MVKLFQSNEQKLSIYRDFIVNCTASPNSAKNYSDFTRLDSIIKRRFQDFSGTFECEDPDFLQTIYDELSQISSFEEFDGNKSNRDKDFKKLGGGQYHNTLLTYIRFLRAALVFRGITDCFTLLDSSKNQQIIYYGAPGTGKSHAIEVATEGQDVIRTTFHPDSDYSTFVGAYKPTTKEIPMRDVTGKIIIENGKQVTENRIVYEFVSQAFLQAYVGAWEKFAANGDQPQPQYLVIEEINRGNCAQIFGDLFQLLDRNASGFSEYPIKADADMKKQLNKLLSGLIIDNAEAINALYKGKDVVSQVLDGDVLLLPSNLYIWATMNTSDQSLFPIDSAFKRRWDWRYVRIDDAHKGWKIEANGKRYDWWDFLEKINRIIGDTTSSEDKKLGYFFCKTADGIISAETFVSKVVFYLWNDVFKDYEFEGDIFVDEDKTSKLSFDKFYITDANGQTVANEAKVDLFLTNLGVKFADDNTMFEGEEEDEDGNTASSSGRDFTKYSVNGIGRYGKNRLAAEAVKQYVQMNPDLSADTVVANWKSLGYIVPHFIETKEEHDSRQDDSKRSQVIPCGDTVIYVEVNGYGGNGKVDVLIEAVNRQDWGLTLSKVE